MAHHSLESMRNRAFTKGRAAFDSDEEYRLALRGELDVREDFGHEANEDPDNGEDKGDRGDLSDEEAVGAELEDLKDRVDRTHFLEVLEKFMQDCSGREEPPYLPFKPVNAEEHIALFCHGSETLRLRYGAYGFEADKMEGDKVVRTWRGLDEIDVLNDWDDDLVKLVEEAELEKEDLEDERKDEFFEDTLPDILADRKNGAAFLDFVTGAFTTGESGAFTAGESGAVPRICLPLQERLWLVRDRAKSEFSLEEVGLNGALATWGEEEFLEKLREVVWNDPDRLDCILGGGLEEVWDALDDAWYDEDEDDLVVDSVEKFLSVAEGAKTDPWVHLVKKDIAVCEEADTGRVEMKMVWGETYPDTAELTFTRDGREETFSEVPLAFLRWWAFGKTRGW